MNDQLPSCDWPLDATTRDQGNQSRPATIQVADATMGAFVFRDRISLRVCELRPDRFWAYRFGVNNKLIQYVVQNIPVLPGTISS